MSEIRYSLCIAELDYNTNELRNKVCRIADFDFDNQCLVDAKYNDWEEERSLENFNPRHISALTETLTPYKAEIRSWQPVNRKYASTGEGYIKAESDSLGVFPIEILKIPQIDLEIHNSDSDIRAILQNGISITEYTSDNFFIVLNKSNDTYEVLLCNRKDFQNTANSEIYKIQKHCQDMLRTVHSLNLHIITENEIFNTEHCTMFVEQGRKAPTRYFYKYLVINRAERKFFLRNPEDYAKAYISKYIKNKKDILKISKADAQKWSAMIDNALTNKSELEMFFDETGFKDSDVEQAFRSLSNEIKELYLQDDAFSQIVERSLLKDPAVFERCKDEAKKIWLSKQDTEKDKVIAETQIFKRELQLARAQKESLSEELDKLNSEVERLLTECKELESKSNLLETKRSKILEDIQSELKRFQEDVVSLAAASALTTSNSDVTARLPLPIFSQSTIDRNISNSEINEINDFIDDLQDNLITYGMINEYSYDFSLLVVSAMLAKKHIIVCGNQADEVANSISLLVNKELAQQIFLPTGYTDINKLISSINQSQSDVFVVYNALDTFSDGLFLSLAKCCKDKFLVFSCPASETYRHLPSYWSNYAVFFYTDFVWGLPTKDDFRCGVFDILGKKQLYKIEKGEFLLQVEDSRLITRVQINTLTNLESICRSLNSNADMTSFPILCNMCTSLRDEKEAFFEIVEKVVTDENLVQLLKDEFSYE